MRILFITPSMDENFGGGRASIRNYNALSSFSEVDVYQISKKSNFCSALSVAQCIYPPCTKEDVRKISDKIKEIEYDYIFVDTSFFGHIIRMANKLGVRTCTFFFDCAHDYNDVRFGGKKTIKSIVYQILLDKSEKLTVDYSFYKFVFTSRDKKRIEELYDTKVDAVIPIGMVDQFGGNDDGEGSYCLLFGPCQSANEEGFGWFVNNVSSKLNCKTMIAGKGFEKHIDDWSSEKVEVQGFVDDLNALYSGALCVAIPLLSGCGMKIKTSEALMFGKNIFGTDEAYVGYDKLGEDCCRICNSANEFIESINSFIDSGCNSYNSNSRELFLANYEANVGARIFKNLMCDES